MNRWCTGIEESLSDAMASVVVLAAAPLVVVVQSGSDRGSGIYGGGSSSSGSNSSSGSSSGSSCACSHYWQTFYCNIPLHQFFLLPFIMLCTLIRVILCLGFVKRLHILSSRCFQFVGVFAVEILVVTWLTLILIFNQFCHKFTAYHLQLCRWSIHHLSVQFMSTHVVYSWIFFSSSICQIRLFAFNIVWHICKHLQLPFPFLCYTFYYHSKHRVGITTR